MTEGELTFYPVGTTCCTLAVLFPGLGLQYVLDDGLIKCGRVHQEAAYWGCAFHWILRRQYHWPADFHQQ